MAGISVPPARFSEGANHMLSSLHHPLVDDLGGVIPPCIDVDAFFYHGVGSGPQRLACLVPAWLDRRAGLLGE